MLNTRSLISGDSIERERPEALIAELKSIRKRELEVLIEIKEIIRSVRLRSIGQSLLNYSTFLRLNGDPSEVLTLALKKNKFQR
jgi:hypothetical protein